MPGAIPNNDLLWWVAQAERVCMLVSFTGLELAAHPLRCLYSGCLVSYVLAMALDLLHLVQSLCCQALLSEQDYTQL